MNKLFTFLFFLIWNFSFSQLTVSTKYIEIYSWDDEKDAWGEIIVEDDQFSFFEFNEEMTFLNFTTIKEKTSFFLTDSEYSEEHEHFSYEVTSDSGYESTLIVDLKSDLPNIRLVIDVEDSNLLIRYTVKNYWFEDEE
ncbi:hypothetical protein N9Q99_01425 [Flavobacteriales bacterium]|nr:hypothetical protein [Flavobacteriales bacterium]